MSLFCNKHASLFFFLIYENMQDNDIDKLHDYANTQNNYDVFRANK